jgi:hypothetical protein
MTRILFDTWVSFLEKNGLRHIYMNGEDNGRAFIFASDAEKYDNTRGLYYPLSSTPFLVAADNCEMAKCIEIFDFETYKRKVKQFLFDKGCIDKGNASKAVVDLIKDIINCDKVYERVDECH